MKAPLTVAGKSVGLLALLAMAMIYAWPVPASAETDDRQYKIEAAFLYNFFNYITWPGFASPQEMQQPTICLFGDDPVGPYLAYIQRKKTGRQIVIRQMHPGESGEGCNILFLRDESASGKIRMPEMHKALVVEEYDGALDKGGMIELLHDEERMRMKINQSLLEKDNFQVSSRLLNLAEEVIR